MFRELSDKIRWKAVILGWAVAIATGIVLNLLFEAAHILLFGGEVLDAGEPHGRGRDDLLVIWLFGPLRRWYVAGRKARIHGGLHSVMVAILGFLFVLAAVVIVAAIVAATAGIVLVERGIPFPSLTLGFAGGALLASLVLLILNLLGGFFGGKLGEWETGPTSTSGGAIKTPGQS